MYNNSKVVILLFQYKASERSHIRLAVIADDITGAFDTGVQFSKRGARVLVTTQTQVASHSTEADVLVIDAQTRHLTPEQAYTQTRRVLRATIQSKIPYLYVKTDSGLRGNIGPAFKAALDETGETFIAFSPAYPDTNRVTRGGKQWIDGLPIQDSVFGRDLFEPVRVSRVSDLLRPYGLNVSECHVPYQLPAHGPVVAVFDVERNDDFKYVAELLKEHDRLRIMAGCAAFASALPAYLGLPDRPQPSPVVRSPLMIICGSLNPITRCQLEYGERLGYTRIKLTQSQLLTEGYFDSDEGRNWLASIELLIRKDSTLMFDTGLSHPKDCSPYQLAQMRVCIARQLGILLLHLLSLNGARNFTPMIIGGDTLSGFLEQLGTSKITLDGEVSTGVVMFTVCIAGQNIQMLSKSGGFGAETLLTDVITQNILAR